MVAIALVLISVFVPVSFLGGLTGQFYRQFALTLAVSVGISAVVALTLHAGAVRPAAQADRTSRISAGLLGRFFARSTAVSSASPGATRRRCGSAHPPQRALDDASSWS